MATVVIRSVLRSATRSACGAIARLSVGVKPEPAPSPFRIASQKPLSARIFRLPVEMSSVSIVSLLPYHIATASSVLTSMLSVAPRGRGLAIEAGETRKRPAAARKLQPTITTLTHKRKMVARLSKEKSYSHVPWWFLMTLQGLQ